ncbi:MAG: hypothetical protein AAGA66_05375 [Bacteroidota bacterium]
MKKLPVMMMMLCIIISCEDPENQPVPMELSTVELVRAADTTQTLPIYPLQNLFSRNITTGNFFFANRFRQALTISNGKLVCHSDYPGLSFQRIWVRSGAVSGIYRDLDGMVFGYDAGKIIVFPDAFHENYSAHLYARKIVLHLKCPKGCGTYFVTPKQKNARSTELKVTIGDDLDEETTCAISDIPSTGNFPKIIVPDSIDFQTRPWDQITFFSPNGGHPMNNYCLFTGGNLLDH